MTIEPGQVYRPTGHSDTKIIIVGLKRNGDIVAESLYDGGISMWTPEIFDRAFELIPPKIVRYVNVYDNGYANLYARRDDADGAASHKRIACLRLEFEPGQMDE